ncbi:class I SAM-dependent methyltransferase [Micromonospora carbonacea]|uniref:Methyltransferase domain-containing protein n=1 Tax=Micromonospora carbonacea TaxID=47853 RepID=A0A1C4V6B0_9ACTN|nr:class I SAM-dependent methyltransferase [Micromonospora carbonacea]SCE79494.1 Methyltransferase domain-containing protein [Micromonospora carbonacea]
MSSAETEYAVRARSYAAEVAAGLTAPRMLDHLLRPGTTVAEIPSGTGHFVRRYAEAGCATLLIDASAQILAAAERNVAGIPHVTLLRARVEDLPTGHPPVDLAVIPNGALNQLAHDLPLPDILRAVAGMLAPGGRILVQALLGEPTERCGFYEPQASGSWFVDRRIPDPAGGALVRRRRQRRHGNHLSIDFALTRDRDGAVVYRHTVVMRMLDRADVTDAAATVGLTVAAWRAGLGQLSEVVLARASA